MMKIIVAVVVLGVVILAAVGMQWIVDSMCMSDEEREKNGLGPKGQGR